MNKNGFTLIELLVVVAIIGIIAAVGTVAYTGYSAGAKDKTLKYNHDLVLKFLMTKSMECEIGNEEMFFKDASGNDVNQDLNPAPWEYGRTLFKLESWC